MGRPAKNLRHFVKCRLCRTSQINCFCVVRGCQQSVISFITCFITLLLSKKEDCYSPFHECVALVFLGLFYFVFKFNLIYVHTSLLLQVLCHHTSGQGHISKRSSGSHAWHVQLGLLCESHIYRLFSTLVNNQHCFSLSILLDIYVWGLTGAKLLFRIFLTNLQETFLNVVDFWGNSVIDQ